ncbi:hypothetical protein ASD24_27610 [Paenibacillus sp. Root52]|nr:hypothetical protein ASD24_27610 [Paenibacillus sp. Root52]
MDTPAFYYNTCYQDTSSVGQSPISTVRIAPVREISLYYELYKPLYIMVEKIHHHVQFMHF